ncbi:MAG TPA: amino acid deaminase [Actinomycetota bacterium]|nr:amino acid deaminase [Actinomycetota bacterium]
MNTSAMNDDVLTPRLDWRWKGFPPAAGAVTADTIREQKWNVLAGDMLLPVMVMKESALQHNLGTVASFCRERGVSLAPHGKTTMAPQLVRRQFDYGAWAVCAATVSQARIFRAFGAPRVLIANEVVDAAAITWIAQEKDRHPEVELYSLVDSIAGVSLMIEALEAHRMQSQLSVLVEIGAPGARAGCRTADEALAVADAVAGSGRLRLAGVEGYEGIIHRDGMDATLAAIDTYLDTVRTVTHDLAARGLFADQSEVIVSAGGSAYFDRVVERLTEPWDIGIPARIVLRSGCYLTHDDGHYDRLSPFGSVRGDARLRPALEVWGAVLSRPEPELAIVGFGKRDVPYDRELPVIRKVMTRRGDVRSPDGGLVVTALDDQHAYVRVEGDMLEVGALIGCGISHPCTAFDKWPLIPVVDDDYNVIDAVRTFF